MKPGQFYWIIMIFIMSISYARARQGQALAKIRVDEKGNVEVLELNANEQSVETESFPLLNSWESENPSSGTVPYSEISSTKQIVSSESHTPVNPMGTGPDLTYVPENCSMSYSYPNLTIKVRIKNQGDQYAPASILGYYLIEYNGTRKEQIGWDKVPILKPRGLYYDKTVTVDISEYVGKWRVCFIIDDLNSVSEDNESNNVKTFSEPISVGPDLVVTNVTVTDGLGLEIGYQYTIKNQGSSSTGGNFSTNIYLSPDNIIEKSDYCILIVSCSPMDASEEYNSGVRLRRVYKNATPGEYYLGVYTDVRDVISESNENNNTGYDKDLKVNIPPNSDLTINRVKVTNGSGPEIEYWYTICNLGNASTGTGFKSDIYLSLDNTIKPSDDYKIDEKLHNALDVGRSLYSALLQTTVSGVPPGEYCLGIYVDGEDVISESYEDNNTNLDSYNKVTIPQSPPAQPDLVVTDVTVIDAQGPDISYNVNVKNDGDGATDGSKIKTRFYLSPDDNITTDDYLIDDWNFEDVLVPGASKASYDLTSTVSSVSSGDYYLGAITDAEDMISESDENNNTGYCNDPKVTIPQPPQTKPDLIVTDVTVIDAQGPDIRYQYTVKNQGNTFTGAQFKNYIYLSSDKSINSSSYYRIDEQGYGILGPDQEQNSYTMHTTVIGVPPGEYYLVVYADGYNEISESNENNNTGYDNDSKVIIPLHSDLIVSSVTATNGLGPEIGYQYTVKNQGNASTGVGFKNYIFLSSDYHITLSDYMIDEQQFSALGSNKERDSGTLKTTVSGVPPGEYFLGVYTDGAIAISEWNENNNTGFDVARVTIPQAKPDLVVTRVTVTDGSGSEIHYQFAIKNQGDAATGAGFKNYIYLSLDKSINPSEDCRIDEQQCIALDAGAEYSSSDLQTTVSGLPAGDYYLVVYTDGARNISESNENNNTGYCNDPRVTILQPPPTQPDLIIVSVNVTNGSGPEIGYQYTFKNRGDASTGTGFKNYIYLSSDKSITSSDYKIDEQECNALDAGAGSNPGSLQTTVSDVPAGEYYLGVYTDAEDVISESNETNNTKFDNDPKVYILQSPPLQSDLIVTDVTVIDAQGLEIKYQYTIKNQGDGKAGPFKNYVYLSPDNTITQSDYQINSWECSELDADAEYNSGPLLQTTASSVPPGEYYLGVYTDAEDVISESQENNNTGYDNDPKVIIPLYSDMIVVSVNVKDGSGPEIGYQYTFKNRGNASTGIGFNNYIYLSSDKSITSSDYKIDEQEYNALDAGAGRNPGTLQTTVSGVPAGEYYLGVYTDAEDVIPELQENNNTRYADSRVTISEGSESPVETESCECNMITNWSFSQGMENWQFFAGGAGTADCSVEKGAFHAQITSGGDYPHEVTLHHYGLTIVHGNTYTVTFKARAEGSRNIRAWVAMSEEPWVLYNSDFQYTLTNEWQTFTYTFTMNYPTDPQARLGFDFGTSDVDVYLDNVCLIEMVSSTDVTLNESSMIPGDFALFQNFPNPFNPSTTIRYAVPKSCHVNLTVYNLVGKEIAVLVNETRTPGEYSVVWNGKDLASSIYLCRLKAGNHIEMRKMMLQK